MGSDAIKPLRSELLRRFSSRARENRFNEPAMTPSPRLALLTVVATLAYLGLAILGSGGFALFFSHPALIALTVALFAMSGVALFSEGNLSAGEREDRANRWVIAALGLIGVVAAYLPGLH